MKTEDDSSKGVDDLPAQAPEGDEAWDKLHACAAAQTQLERDVRNIVAAAEKEEVAASEAVKTISSKNVRYDALPALKKRLRFLQHILEKTSEAEPTINIDTLAELVKQAQEDAQKISDDAATKDLMEWQLPAAPEVLPKLCLKTALQAQVWQVGKQARSAKDLAAEVQSLREDKLAAWKAVVAATSRLRGQAQTAVAAADRELVSRAMRANPKAKAARRKSESFSS